MAGEGIRPSDDFALMQAIAAGDRDAISALYDRHSPLLLAICRRIVNDAGEAEDVLIDVFMELWTRADRFDPSRGNPLTYLITLARSRSIDRKRSMAIRPAVTSDITDNSAAAARASSAIDPLQSTNLNEQCAIIHRALAELEPSQRQALECAFYDGLSHSEIAEQLNKPLGSIKTYIRQGLIRLRETLRTNQ